MNILPKQNHLKKRFTTFHVKLNEHGFDKSKNLFMKINTEKKQNI